MDSDFGDVHREVRKVITKDSNVACVAEAIACAGALAKGLRKAYRGTAASLCPGAAAAAARGRAGSAPRAAWDACS